MASKYNFIDLEDEIKTVSKPVVEKVVKEEDKELIIDTSYKAVVNTGALNVRAAAGLDKKVLRVVHKGDTLTIVKEDGKWGKLDTAGWVMLEFIKKV